MLQEYNQKPKMSDALHLWLQYLTSRQNMDDKGYFLVPHHSSEDFQILLVFARYERDFQRIGFLKVCRESVREWDQGGFLYNKHWRRR